MELIGGILGVVSFFMGWTTVLVICAIVCFGVQLFKVIKRIQYSLNSVLIFTAIGFVGGLITHKIVLMIALAICTESVLMNVILPVFFRLKNKKNDGVSNDVPHSDNDTINRIYKEIQNKISGKYPQFHYLDVRQLYSFSFCCDNNAPLDSGSTINYRIDANDNNSYSCLITAAIGGNIPQDKSLDEYNEYLNKKFYNDLNGKKFVVNTEYKFPLIQLQKTIEFNGDDATIVQTIISSFDEMISLCKKRYVDKYDG